MLVINYQGQGGGRGGGRGEGVPKGGYQILLVRWGQGTTTLRTPRRIQSLTCRAGQTRLAAVDNLVMKRYYFNHPKD